MVLQHPVAQHRVRIHIRFVELQRRAQILLRRWPEFSLRDMPVQPVCPAQMRLNIGLPRPLRSSQSGVEHGKYLIQLRRRHIRSIGPISPKHLKVFNPLHRSIQLPVERWCVKWIRFQNIPVAPDGCPVLALLCLPLRNRHLRRQLSLLCSMTIKHMKPPIEASNQPQYRRQPTHPRKDDFDWTALFRLLSALPTLLNVILH